MQYIPDEPDSSGARKVVWPLGAHRPIKVPLATRSLQLQRHRRFMFIDSTKRATNVALLQPRCFVFTLAALATIACTNVFWYLNSPVWAVFAACPMSRVFCGAHDDGNNGSRKKAHDSVFLELRSCNRPNGSVNAKTSEKGGAKRCPCHRILSLRCTKNNKQNFTAPCSDLLGYGNATKKR